MNKVYYYHLVSISECHRLWEKGEYPGHLLYGLTHLYKHGLDAIYDDIPFNPFKSRIRLMIYMLKTLVFSRKKYDAIYAVTFRGLELVIFYGLYGFLKSRLQYGIILQSLFLIIK